MAETTIGFEPPAVVLADAIEAPLTDLTSYRAVGGYAQLERARAMTPHDVTDQLIQSNLRGRGGLAGLQDLGGDLRPELHYLRDQPHQPPPVGHAGRCSRDRRRAP